MYLLGGGFGDMPPPSPEKKSSGEIGITKPYKDFFCSFLRQFLHCKKHVTLPDRGHSIWLVMLSVG